MRTDTTRRRPCRRWLGPLLILGLILGPLAARLYARDWPAQVHVISAGQHRSIYPKGSTSPIVNEDLRVADGQGPDGRGTVFYCLDQSINGVDTHPQRAAWQAVLDGNEAALRGLVALLDHAAPNANGADDWSASIQATRFAIWAWMNHCGFTSNTMTRDELFHGYEPNAAIRFAQRLFSIAEAGAELRDGLLRPQPAAPQWRAEGGQLRCSVVVDGAFDRFQIVVPDGVEAAPTEGEPGQRVVLSAPLALGAAAVDLQLTAQLASRSAARYGWYSGAGVTQDLVGHPGPSLHVSDRRTLTLAPVVSQLRVLKRDAEGRALDGARFRLEDAAGQALALTGEAGAYRPGAGDNSFTTRDGVAVIHDLLPGRYRVVELAAPSGYVLDATPYEVELVAAETSEVAIANAPQQGVIRLFKCDEAGAAIAGAEFALYRGEEALGTLTSDASGYATSPVLPLGDYRLVERYVPAPFVLDATPIDIVLRGDGHAPVVEVERRVPNRRQTGRLQLLKRSREGQPIAGARFELYYEDETEPCASLETDAAGNADVAGLRLGRYRVLERFVPAPWLLDPRERELVFDYSDMHRAENLLQLECVNDAARGRIRLIKRDLESGERAQGDARFDGAQFAILTVDGEVCAELSTDEQGQALSEQLPLGRYRIIERQAPPGYVASDDAVEVELSYQDMTTAIVIADCILPNRVLKGGLRIDKSRQIQHPDGRPDPILHPLAGVRFRMTLISDPEQRYFAESDADGIVQWDALPYGDYRLEEETPDWALPLPAQTIHIPRGDVDGAIAQLDIVNQHYEARIRLIKVDRESGEAIRQAGVQFRIVDLATGEPVRQTIHYPSERSIEVWETDETGAYTLPYPLPVGDYRVEELSAPEGYVLSEEHLIFRVDGSVAPGDLLELRFADRRIHGRIAIEKRDALSGAPLAGILFEVLDEADKPVATLLSDDEGRAETEPLPYGRYRIVERQAAPGYCLDRRTHELAIVEEGQCVTVTVENDASDIAILKVDEEGRPLAGVLFEVRDREGRAMPFIRDDYGYRYADAAEDGAASAELTSDTGGELRLRALPFGDYVLHELQPPEGFEAAEPMAISLRPDLPVNRLRVINRRIPPPPTPTCSQSESSGTTVAPRPLPQTGRTPEPIWTGGGLLLAGVAALGTRRRRRRTR